MQKESSIYWQSLLKYCQNVRNIAKYGHIVWDSNLGPFIWVPLRHSLIYSVIVSLNKLLKRSLQLRMFFVNKELILITSDIEHNESASFDRSDVCSVYRAVILTSQVIKLAACAVRSNRYFTWPLLDRRGPD